MKFYLFTEDYTEQHLGDTIDLDETKKYIIRSMETLQDTVIDGKDISTIKDNKGNLDYDCINRQSLSCGLDMKWDKLSVVRPFKIERVNETTLKNIGICREITSAKDIITNYEEVIRYSSCLIQLRCGMYISYSSYGNYGVDLALIDDEWLCPTESAFESDWRDSEFQLVSVISRDKLNKRLKSFKRVSLLSGERILRGCLENYLNTLKLTDSFHFINIKTGECLTNMEASLRLGIRCKEHTPSCYILNSHFIVRKYPRYYGIRKNAKCIAWDSNTWTIRHGAKEDVISELGGEQNFRYRDSSEFNYEPCIVPCQVLEFKRDGFTFAHIGGTGFAFICTSNKLFAIRCEKYYLTVAPYFTSSNTVRVLNYRGKDEDLLSLPLSLQDIYNALDTYEVLDDVISLIETNLGSKETEIRG